MLFLWTATRKELDRSSLSFYLDTDYDSLVKAFGLPDRTPSDDMKVTCEWRLKVILTDSANNKKTVYFSIYNWKDSTPPHRNTNWHVGSHGKDNNELATFLSKVGTVWR